MTTITIELTFEETERLLERAQAQGYDALDAFVHDLVTTETTTDENEDDEDRVEGFRIAWRQTMRGETMSWEEFLTEMNEEQRVKLKSHFYALKTISTVNSLHSFHSM